MIFLQVRLNEDEDWIVYSLFRRLPKNVPNFPRIILAKLITTCDCKYYNAGTAFLLESWICIKTEWPIWRTANFIKICDRNEFLFSIYFCRPFLSFIPSDPAVTQIDKLLQSFCVNFFVVFLFLRWFCKPDKKKTRWVFVVALCVVWIPNSLLLWYYRHSRHLLHWRSWTFIDFFFKKYFCPATRESQIEDSIN